ncbi:hypothetical protein AEAC466_07580 [Asticcacaulis sp. AC466]|uniref:SURF1 family protein n=1 Tax=Asticcacaulis sp. AC466 TaxID=1282362 RepID=UPI0003C3B1CB|nr:SURF1 family protein [Asticcacaulis sp. AC466]ESQ84910.1 hypothetical protein AEAC466_07580 [Asticcacaulis sp. AC466]
MRRIAFAILLILSVAGLTALGVWQLQRLAWKTHLIAQVNERTTAPAIPAPGPGQWAGLSKSSDEYRHVTIEGHYLNAAEAQVYALTELGAGYWVLTPLKMADGTIVFINRGYVPTDKKAPATRPLGQSEAEVRVTGLLRMSETKGWLFSQENDPDHDAWYRRDVATIARARHLGSVAPYFIDADATHNPGGLPKGGMTVVQFPNSHLAYALTWFSLALMLAGAGIWLWRRGPGPAA